MYQRAGEPCLRCGRPIRRIVVGGRSTHFCGWCQRLPAGAASGGGRETARRPAGAAPPAGRPLRRGPRWTELSARARSAGRRERGSAAAAQRAAADRAPGASPPLRKAAAARRRRRPRRRDRLMSIVRLDGRRPRGRRLRHPRPRRRRRSPPAIGSASSARTAPARRPCCGSWPASTSPTAARSIASAA